MENELDIHADLGLDSVLDKFIKSNDALLKRDLGVFEIMPSITKTTHGYIVLFNRTSQVLLHLFDSGERPYPSTQLFSLEGKVGKSEIALSAKVGFNGYVPPAPEAKEQQIQRTDANKEYWFLTAPKQ